MKPASASAWAVLLQILCFSLPLLATGRSPQVFRHYIGVNRDIRLNLTDVPLPADDILEIHFILSFAIDYVQDAHNRSAFIPTNGHFLPYWNNVSITPEAIKAIKAKRKGVKVMVSIGGDSVSGPGTPGTEVNFTPQNASSWISNAVSSLTNIMQRYHLDGIDIDYEHFTTDPITFAQCIGEVITKLKRRDATLVASIAPFDGVQRYYQALWKEYGHIIDYVNFQFYTYDTNTSATTLVNLYERAMATYDQGIVLASYSTDPDAFIPLSTCPGTTITPRNMLKAYSQLQLKGQTHGMFVWVADTSSVFQFKNEIEAQKLVAGAHIAIPPKA